MHGKNWHYVILVEVVMIRAVSLWDRKCNIYGTCTIKRKCYNCRSVTTEVLNIMRHRMRIWTITPEGLEIISWRSTGSITLLAERTRLQTLVYETTRRPCLIVSYLAPFDCQASLENYTSQDIQMLYNILDLFLKKNRATESLYANLFSASTYRIRLNAEIKLVTKKIWSEFLGFGTEFPFRTLLTLSFKNPLQNIRYVYIFPLKFTYFECNNHVCGKR